MNWSFNFLVIALSQLSLLALAQPNLQKLNWTMWDVSILLPLPNDLTKTKLLLSTEDIGNGGPLLPERVIAKMPTLVGKMQNNEVFKSNLKVVAIRIDPCFQEGFSPLGCRSQIRFIWQPVIFKNKQLTTLDAAAHTFYELNSKQWTTFIAEYENLVKQELRPNHLDLSIHPVIQSQGLNGKMWSQLRKLFLRYCGEYNLSQATVMTVEASEDFWVFAGFRVSTTSVEPLVIPVIQAQTQSIMMASNGAEEFIGSVIPINFPDIGLWFFDNSQNAKLKFSENDFREWSHELLKVEDPRQHNSGTTDCVSCHASAPILKWQKANFKKWDWKEMISERGFTSDQHSLINSSDAKSKTDHFRAFGYQDKEPRFSQRVINESALVVDQLNQ